MGLERRLYRWNIQDGSGETWITCDPDTENATAEVMVERKVAHGCPFGMGYRHFELLRREPAS